ncbi:MAG: energy-coupling factor transporter transmembrane protein EcfT [Clostridia bacterium]|nr:energy-coupling factor transporter transmembrane protein EcfT [Clostridia bacterium]
MNRSAFYRYHPLPLFLYFVFVLLLTMFSFDPILLTVSLLGAVSFFIFVNRSRLKVKNFILYSIVFLTATLSNPLFSHNGITVLFFMGDNAVTLESIYYGMNIGLMIVSVMIWCRNYSICVTEDKFLYLFSKPLPKAALILSCAIRFIPLFRQKFRQISDAQKGLGMYETKKGFQKLRFLLNVFSALVTWSLEKSIETADSMKSRGYELKGKTSFSPFVFRKRDCVLLVSSIVLFFATVVGIASGSFEFSFYPVVTAAPWTKLKTVCLAAFTFYSLIPLFVELKENYLWKYYVSKI